MLLLDLFHLGLLDGHQLREALFEVLPYAWMRVQ